MPFAMLGIGHWELLLLVLLGGPIALAWFIYWMAKRSKTHVGCPRCGQVYPLDVKVCPKCNVLTG